MQKAVFPQKRIISVFISAMLFIYITAGCGAGENIDTVAIGQADINEPVSINEAADDPQSTTEAIITEPKPDNDWEFDTPDYHGVDGAILERLHESVKETEMYSIVIAKDGFIIDEYYKEGYDENSVFRLASCSKTFTGALIGVAIDQGLINGVDVLLADILPQLADSDEPQKKEITIRHLLTHTSGIEWYEWGGNASSWQPFVTADNWVDYILSRRMVSQPGATFNYTTGGSHLLAAALQEATGKSEYEFGVEHVFSPIGMDSVQWAADPQGITDGGNGISMNARDAAKFGQLYLDGGRWKGRQILPEEWVEQSVQQQSAGSGNSGRYGYQWWLRPFGAGNYATYYAMGHGGQFVFVIPELNLVTVITSRFPQNTYAPWPYFTDYILAACTES